MKVIISIVILMLGLTAGTTLAESGRDLLVFESQNAYSNLPIDAYSRDDDQE